MNKATWIWYPSDFEMMLGLQLSAKRTERNMHIAPFWRVDHFYNSVIFKKNFYAEENTVVHVHGEGKVCVILDGAYCYEFRDAYRLQREIMLLRSLFII